MVTIIDYQKRQNADGKDFYTLTLQGAVEFVKSSISGNFYATAWKATITSTFTEEVCKSLVGKTVQGIIEKITVDPYEYKIPSTGETIMLTHKWSFNPSPNETTIEETILEPEAEMSEA